MKTTDTFTYHTEYSDYPNCHFVVNRYGTNGNLYLAIYDEEGCICTCSVNTDVKLPDSEIGIKNYGENANMDLFLKKIGIIGDSHIGTISSGFVLIPVFKLTDSGKELFQIVLDAPF